MFKKVHSRKKKFRKKSTRRYKITTLNLEKNLIYTILQYIQLF